MRYRQLNDTTRSGRSPWILVLVAALLVIPACGDDDTTSNGDPNSTASNTTVGNTAPEAAAAVPDGPFGVGEQIELDATGSTDADGQELSFTWRLDKSPQGADPDLLDSDSDRAVLIPDMVGDYDVSVEVSDGIDAANASVSVSVIGAPSADAGADATVEVNQTHTFDGSASQAAGGDLTYSWEFVSTPGASGATLQDTDTAMPSLTPDEAGSYIVELTVDNGVDQATDRVTLEATPAGGIVDSTVWVSPTGDDTNVGTEDAPLATLDAAIDTVRDLESADRIELLAGTYDVANESWEILDDLDIRGPDGGGATITGEASEMFVVSSDAFLTLVDITIETTDRAFTVGDDAALSFIRVTCRARICILSGQLLGNPGGRIQIDDSVIEAGGSGTNSTEGITTLSPDELSVTNSTISGFGNHGIIVVDGPLTLSASEVSDNGTGLSLIVNQSANPTEVSDTDFLRNEVGVSSEGAENVTIRDSNFEEQTDDAIFVENGTLIVRDSTVTTGDSDGAEVSESAIFTARGTTFDDNAEAGVRVVGAGARVDLGTDTDDGNNSLIRNGIAGLYDDRPAGASGTVEMSSTSTLFFMGVGLFPPAGTYSGPGFDQHGIQILRANDVVVHP